MPARPVINLRLRSRAAHAAPKVLAAVRETLRRSKMENPGEINVVFLTNPEIRAYNRKYLDHDYATDVIAFGYQEESRKFDPALPFGDILISVDQARIQAKDLGHSLLEELVTLAAHGTLHLLGYDDRGAADKKKMFARQNEIVAAILGA